MGSTLAYAAGPVVASGSSASSSLLQLGPIVFFFGLFYFLFLRPQQNQAKAHKEMVNKLKVGDRVLTQGGIYGTVVNLKGSTVLIKIADNVKVEIGRSAITQVILEPTNGTSTPSDAEGKIIS